MQPVSSTPPAAIRIGAALARELGGQWAVVPLQASSFCNTWRASNTAASVAGELFVKSLPAAAGGAHDGAHDGAHERAHAGTLEAEADGLAALAAARMIRVPAVRGCWLEPALGETVLALEWLDLRKPDRDFGARFGRALGALHRAAPAQGDGRFGWHRDNLLGATPQRNRWSRAGATEDWISFLRSERLGAMCARLARSAPALVSTVDAVMDVLPSFFADGHVPRASLIHGDLWSGNWGMLADGTPVIYDPAVSCSDAEADLAMMELFGAPPAGFWPAYAGVAPLHAGYARRRALYQLYHLLNHAVLFGGGYVAQAEQVAVRLVSGR